MWYAVIPLYGNLFVKVTVAKASNTAIPSEQSSLTTCPSSESPPSNSEPSLNPPQHGTQMSNDYGCSVFSTSQVFQCGTVKHYLRYVTAIGVVVLVVEVFAILVLKINVFIE